jgi:small-conductance mechanosensitive channel
MDTLLQWINEPGPIRWVVDILILPLIAVLLIFGLRALVLPFVLRGEKPATHREIARQAATFGAILISLLAVTLIWRFRLADLAARSEGSTAQRQVLFDWLIGSGYAVIATIVLILSLTVLNRAYKAAVAKLNRLKQPREGVRVPGTVLVSVRQFAGVGLRIARFALIIGLFYLYVPLVLNFIPATRPLADQVMPVVLDPARQFGLAVLGYLPKLVSLIIIVVAARYFLRLISYIMAAASKGAITIRGFDPEWADQTARLMKVVVILATVMIIYPFLPGAGSELFKGFSVFAGALFTLGASGSVSNVISGVTLTYSRSFKLGDRVEIGGTIGDVVSRGLFVTRLRTIYNEEITLPNTVALGNRVVNYSAARNSEGLVLQVTAGIGYDVDWRQVHELMKNAARATEHVLDDPEPTVIQDSLGDFAVQYKLLAWTDNPKLAVGTRSALRQSVLDQFAEAGVEIMTPDVHAVRNSAEPAIPADYTTDATPSALRLLGLQGSSPSPS